MDKEVELTDRKDHIEYFRMALAMCQIGVTYQMAELIDEIREQVREKGDAFSVVDAAVIHSKWDKFWKMYFETKEAEKELGFEK